MQVHHIPVRRSARYFSLGELSENTRHIWIVCHGYGQLAEFFLKNFVELENKETVIIAPEALSRFYLSGNSGRIGATWMTSEDRLNEIEDYVHYLDNLLQETLAKATSDVKINVLGFSQGVSTVCRWVFRSNFHFQAFVLWAGSLPPELPELAKENHMLRVPIYIVTGNNDPYLTPEISQNQNKLIAAAGIKPEFYFFDGKHEINKELLKDIFLRIS